jgi:AmmeMemoRadiSam system protein A
MFTDAERDTLLDLARRSVTAHVTHAPPPAMPPAPGNAPWPQVSGVFVTLKRHRQLRGCLGTLDSHRSVVEDVARLAAEASSDDPRFSPMTPDELAGTTLEISVLGPLARVSAPDDIVIGRHGLVVEQGHRRGLLLPQVASERSWSVPEFLRQTCIKAGLPTDAWERGATVYTFDAEVFGE